MVQKVTRILQPQQPNCAGAFISCYHTQAGFEIQKYSVIHLG